MKVNPVNTTPSRYIADVVIRTRRSMDRLLYVSICILALRWLKNRKRTLLATPFAENFNQKLAGCRRTNRAPGAHYGGFACAYEAPVVGAGDRADTELVIGFR